jgi:Tfp pilus assembly protein PilF
VGGAPSPLSDTAVTADRTEARRLLPRWRPWQMALLLREMSPANPSSAPDRFAPALDIALRDWNQTPTASRGAEVLTAALSHPGHQDEVREVAVRLRDGMATSHLRRLAEVVLRDAGGTARAHAEWQDDPEPFDDSETARLISELRRRTRTYPRNALTWTDLARAYFAEGLDEQARRSLEIALALEPNSRFIVRSAARFLVHNGDEDRARRVVAAAANSDDDPWLLSVKVALSASSRRNTLRAGESIMSSGSFDPWHVGELGAVLATREDDHGKARVARRLMRQALVDPTENVLAHAEWASHLVTQEIPAGRMPRAPFEALARRSARRLEWASAASHAWQWHHDEPFSALAAGTGSCYAIYAEEFDRAERMTTVGLKASPDDATLLNNRAFARACRWKLREALDDFNAINFRDADPDTQACALATVGFIAYRAGSHDLGRSGYERAIRHFQSRKQATSAARAMINLASEEVRAETEHAESAIRRAADLVDAARSAEVDALWARLSKRIVLGTPEPLHVADRQGIAQTVARRLPLIDSP